MYELRLMCELQSDLNFVLLKITYLLLRLRLIQICYKLILSFTVLGIIHIGPHNTVVTEIIFF